MATGGGARSGVDAEDGAPVAGPDPNRDAPADGAGVGGGEPAAGVDFRTLLLDGHVSDIAPRLLGAELRHGERAGTIVEVEAYDGPGDPASHAARGPTPRSDVMFGPPGHLYVYLSYGMHHCANVVCGPDGVGSAILVRAIEPTAGLSSMWSDRPKARTERDLASGPGKLCAALGIDRRHDRVDLLDEGSPVRLLAPAGWTPGQVSEVAVGRRVGITKAVERPWRFAVAGNPHVSRPHP